MKDIFVEGFVTLSHELEADLSVPFLGFYGDWSEPSVLDGFQVFGEAKYYDLSSRGFKDGLDDRGYFMDYLTDGENNNFYAISPNGDTYNDGINFLTAYLRNAKEVQYNVLDENEKQVRRILTSNYVRKSYYNAGNGSNYSYVDARTWDGKVGGKTAADGKYFYEIKALVDGTDKWQSKKDSSCCRYNCS